MNPNAVLKFLQSLRSLAKSGVIKSVDEAFDFAKREFGEVNDLLKRQIEQVFKPGKPAPKPSEGGITSIKNAPKKEIPDQESGTIMDRIGAASNRIDEIQKEIDAMYKPKPETSPLMQKLEKGVETLKQMKQPGMDLATGLTRTAARKILDRAGIQVPDKTDAIDVFVQEFGADALMDVKNVAEEMIELESMGKSTKSIDEILEQTGMFNIKRNPDAPKGMSDEELEQIKKQVDQEKQLKDFDPTDRTENSMGGIQRLQFKLGGTKKLLALIKEIKKLDPIEAMKEVNEVVAKRGKYENLSDTEVKTIFDETNDHIFERDVPADEFAVRFDEEVDKQKILDDVDEAYGVTPNMKKELDAMTGMGAPKMAERFELKQRFPGIPDELLTRIIDDPDPQNKAEAIATLDQAMELTKQGKDTDEIISVLEKIKKSRRDNSKGGLQYLMGM